MRILLKAGKLITISNGAKIGECQMGVFEIIDWELRTVHHLPVIVNLPPGWHSTSNGSPPEELMADPEFVDDEHFQFVLPTGEKRVYGTSSIP